MSDITFFESQFRRLQAEARLSGMKGSKQKGINLNADVFEQEFFPSARSNGSRRRFNLPLAIYGPGLSSQPQMLTRKIITAGGGGKNWRLNGELIPNPDFDPHRYDQLRPGDLAVFGAEGDSEPTSISMVLVSQANGEDAGLFAALSGALGNQRMASVGEDELSALIATTPETHPIRELIDRDLDEALDSASTGSADGLAQLRKRKSPRRLTAEAFREARLKAEATGFGGEQLLNDWLDQELAAGRILSFKWFFEENAINPWDFEIEDSSGAVRRIEVKTTRSAFKRPFQISQAELEFAADAASPPTDLYRLYEYDDGRARLAVARDIRATAQGILSVVQELAPQVKPDSYTMDIDRFSNWDHLGEIEIEEEETD